MATNQRPLLDPRRKLMLSIGSSMETRDVETALFFLNGKYITSTETEKIRDSIEHPLKGLLPGEELISCLYQSCPNNNALITEVLEACGRLDLSRSLREAVSRDSTVHDIPQQQVDNLFSAVGPFQHIVWFTLSVAKVCLTKYLNVFKQQVQNKLEISPAMMSYLRCDDILEIQNHSLAVFQLCLPNESFIDKLINNSLNAHQWLLDLYVVQVQIDKKSPICLLPGWWKGSEEITVSSNNPPLLRRACSILGGTQSAFHDRVKLDVILVIQIPNTQSIYPGLFRKVLHKLLKAVKRLYNSDLSVRVALITHGTTAVESSTLFFDNFDDFERETFSKTQSVEISQQSFFANALGCVSGFIGGEPDCTLRMEASKVCVAISYLPQESCEIDHYRSDSHDIIKECNKVALHAIPLYVIGIDLPNAHPCSMATSVSEGGRSVNDYPLLTGLSAIGGGKFIHLRDIEQLKEVINFIACETTSIESLMGTVNDLVINKIDIEYGDINPMHLALHVKEALEKRACKVDRMTIGEKPFPLISKLAETISWAESMENAAFSMAQWKEHSGQAAGCRESLPQAESMDVEITPGTGTSSKLGLKQDQPVDIGCAYQMVRRQIQRSAYYRPV
ncbi:uncharacterized protein LOC5515129 [Nematostella vectensis]|uniref:uncharacterized protein LOC5515129 n=1 Tax=Nematostella vectensis TaxID=45351 RepID=UPI002076EF64|nr:uncharacterized protein LOC5515129 [Nematostella vectensis]